VTPVYPSVIMRGVNLLIAAVFSILAFRSSPSRHERQAFEVRQEALREARSSLALGAIIPDCRSTSDLPEIKRAPASNPSGGDWVAETIAKLASFN
jgi:hypothetical protein